MKTTRIAATLAGLLLLSGVTVGCSASKDKEQMQQMMQRVEAAASKAEMAANKAEAAAKSASDSAARAEASASKAEAIFQKHMKK